MTLTTANVSRVVIKIILGISVLMIAPEWNECKVSYLTRDDHPWWFVSREKLAHVPKQSYSYDTSASPQLW